MHVRRFVLVLAIGFSGTAIADASATAQDASGFRCDGTDPFFFEEMNKAGMVGYGETWDESICDQGLAVYGEGASSKWKAFKYKRPYRKSAEDQMLALVVPMVAAGAFAAVFAASSLLAFASRMKKRIVLSVPCPACAAELAIALDDEAGRQLFCPSCGAACGIEITGTKKDATATARLLA